MGSRYLEHRGRQLSHAELLAWQTDNQGRPVTIKAHPACAGVNGPKSGREPRRMPGNAGVSKAWIEIKMKDIRKFDIKVEVLLKAAREV